MGRCAPRCTGPEGAGATPFSPDPLGSSPPGSGSPSDSHPGNPSEVLGIPLPYPSRPELSAHQQPGPRGAPGAPTARDLSWGHRGGVNMTFHGREPTPGARCDESAPSSDHRGMSRPQENILSLNRGRVLRQMGLFFFFLFFFFSLFLQQKETHKPEAAFRMSKYFRGFPASHRSFKTRSPERLAARRGDVPGCLANNRRSDVPLASRRKRVCLPLCLLAQNPRQEGEGPGWRESVRRQRNASGAVPDLRQHTAFANGRRTRAGRRGVGTRGFRRKAATWGDSRGGRLGCSAHQPPSLPPISAASAGNEMNNLLVQLKTETKTQKPQGLATHASETELR